MLAKDSDSAGQAEVGERVEAYRKEHAIVLDELIPRAVAAQRRRVNRVIKTVHRLRKDPGSFKWPIEDPLLCVAIAFLWECMSWWIKKVSQEYGDGDEDRDESSCVKAEEP